MEGRLAGLLGTARRVSKRQRAAAVRDATRVLEWRGARRRPGSLPGSEPRCGLACIGGHPGLNNGRELQRHSQEWGSGADAKLPDGTSVEVIPEERQSEDDPFDAAVRKVAKPRPHWPKDYARNLDHYLYGVPKRSDEGLTEALTGDGHFEQAGFKALLA